MNGCLKSWKDIRKLEFNNKEKFILNSLNLLIANKLIQWIRKNVDKGVFKWILYPTKEVLFYFNWYKSDLSKI